jgi:hypothetical protein
MEENSMADPLYRMFEEDRRVRQELARLDGGEPPWPPRRGRFSLTRPPFGA